MKKLLIVALLSLGMISTTTPVDASSEYPNVRTEYDVNNMAQYKEDDLFKSVTLKKFVILSLSEDKGQYRAVLVPKAGSKQYFYMALPKGKRPHIGDKITVKGTLNGRMNIPGDKASRHFSPDLIGQESTFVLAKSYKIVK